MSSDEAGADTADPAASEQFHHEYYFIFTKFLGLVRKEDIKGVCENKRDRNNDGRAGSET